MRPWTRYVLRATGIACLVVAVSMVAVVGIWYGQGGRILSVQSGSMAPTFRIGDGILLKRVPAAELRIGDVISYHSRQTPQLVVSHRVVSIKGGGALVTTQGDSLRQVDPAVAADQIIGRATAVAPHYGQVVNWLRSPVGLAIAVYMPVVLIISSAIVAAVTSTHT